MGDLQVVSWATKLLEIADFSSIIGNFGPERSWKDDKTQGCNKANPKDHPPTILTGGEGRNHSGRLMR